jgi:hypothetical protein
VFTFLESHRSRRWDVALADPPYRKGLANRLVDLFRERPFADVLCVEHEPGALAGEREIFELTFLTAGKTGSERETDQ